MISSLGIAWSGLKRLTVYQTRKVWSCPNWLRSQTTNLVLLKLMCLSLEGLKILLEKEKMLVTKYSTFSDHDLKAFFRVIEKARLFGKWWAVVAIVTLCCCWFACLLVRNEQFFLFPPCFLPVWRTFRHHFIKFKFVVCNHFEFWSV